MTGGYYAEAEVRFTRWLEKYQLDRSQHAAARRAHPDPAALDARFDDAIRRMDHLFDDCHDRPELREATDLLWRGARAIDKHPHSITKRRLTDIVCVLEMRAGGVRVEPPVGAFLDALTASGSVAILDSACWHIGHRDTFRLFPFCVLQTVVIGEPWGLYYDAKMVDLGSSGDVALRGTCLRLLARMAFLSAERALGNGDTHPFMALLEADGERIYPFGVTRRKHMEHPANQAAFLQVLHLMTFVYRHFPWPRRQYVADVEDARMLRSRPAFWEAKPSWCRDRLRPPLDKILWFAVFVPGVLEVLVENDLCHVLTAYRVMDDKPLIGQLFSTREKEDRLIRLFRDNFRVSSWICGEGERCLLLDLCRQRRRRVLQVTCTY